jgi:hypothetical protein
MVVRRSTISSPKFTRQKRKKRWYRLFLYTIFALTLFFGAAYFSHYPSFVVAQVKIEGNTSTLTNDIDAVISDTLNDSYLWIFSKRNVFLYPRKEIIENIYEKWPSMKLVEADLNTSRVLNVAVQERVASYVWCGRANSFPTSGIFLDATDCFYADENGYIFGTAPKFSGDVYVRLYGERKEEVEFGNPLRSRFLAKDTFEKVQNFIESVERIIGSKVSFIVARENDQYEAGFDRGVRVQFSTFANLDKAKENLKLFIDKARLGTSSMSYHHFDLRYQDKVYFR